MIILREMMSIRRFGLMLVTLVTIFLWKAHCCRVREYPTDR